MADDPWLVAQCADEGTAIRIGYMLLHQRVDPFRSGTEIRVGSVSDYLRARKLVARVSPESLPVAAPAESEGGSDAG